MFYAVGLLLPAIAGLWQVSLGMASPTVVQMRELSSNAAYWSHPANVLTNAVLFRPTVTLHYLALFTLPFALPASVAIATQIGRRERTNNEWTVASRWIVAICAVYVLAGIAEGRIVQHLSRLMPYTYWEFANASALTRAMMTLVTTCGAIAYAAIFINRYFPLKNWRRVTVSERLLDLVALMLLLQHLVYYKFGDRYLIVFLPFAIIVVARYLQERLDRFKVVTTIACAAMLLVSAMWARNMLATNEAEWTASEHLRAAGIEARQIFGPWEWNFYQGALGDYIAEVPAERFPDNLDDYWHRWTPERMKRAAFIVQTSPPATSADITAEVEYRDAFFRRRHVYVVRGTSPAGSGLVP